MARFLDSNFLNALQQQVVEPLVLCEFEFLSGAVRVWTGYGDLSYGGNTYTGTGLLLGLSNIEETNDTTAKNVTFSLSGVPTDVLSLALSEADTCQGRACRMHLGVFVWSGGIRCLYARQIFGGKMDTISISETGTTSTVSLSVENDLLRLLIPSQKLYTDADQKIDHPTDNFFQYVTGIQGADIEWGQA